DAAWHGPTLRQVNWGDAQLAASLGSLFTAIAAAPPAAGSSLDTLLTGLEALGVCAKDATGAICLAADALTGLQADAAGFLQKQLAAALAADAVPGFGASGSGYACQPADAPLALTVQLTPASVALPAGAGGGMAPAPGATLDLTVNLPLTTLQPAISAQLQFGSVTLGYNNSNLTLAIAPALPSLSLYPAPSVSAAMAAMNAALPWLLMEVAGSAALTSLLGANSTVSGLVRFFLNPGASLVGATALGDGQVLDPAKINGLLLGLPALPAGLAVSASGKDPTTISIATTAPIGGVLGLALGVVVDRTRHLAPLGTATLQLPLPGTWANTAITFGVTAGGLTLSVQPGGGAAAIQLLPTFSGSAALAAAAQKLLPAALDGLVGALPAGSALVKLSLGAASALDLYDAAGGFAAHAAQWSALLGPGWLGAVGVAARTAFAQAVAAVFNDASSPLEGLLPGRLSASGGRVIWSYPLPAGVGSGSLSASAGWDSAGATVLLGASGITLQGAPVSFSASAGYGSGGLVLDASVDVSLAGLGITPGPRIELTVTGGAIGFELLPLGPGTSGTLALQLLPAVALQHPENAGRLATQWGVPLAADLLIQATGTKFSQALWSGGPTIENILKSAGIIKVGAGPAPGKYSLNSPLPSA
ncbi:MAG: hypothetical protein ACRD2D_04635, partial [Terriglobales bacterium]